MSYEKLKPCPFCGGKARFNQAIEGMKDNKYTWRKWVYCTNCYAATNKSTNRAEVARAWNKRVGATIPCTTIFSNGMEYECFVEHNCERCTRFRKGKCKIFNACEQARFDKSKFPYEYLLDYESGLAGKECRLFTNMPAERKRKNKQIQGQCTFDMDGESDDN